MDRREFLHLLGIVSVAGMPLPLSLARAEQAAEELYDAPAFGNVSLLHITDTHAQLRPIYFREPNVNISWRRQYGRASPARCRRGVSQAVRDCTKFTACSPFTYLNFERYAPIYGKAGGFAHIVAVEGARHGGRPEAARGIANGTFGSDRNLFLRFARISY